MLRLELIKPDPGEFLALLEEAGLFPAIWHEDPMMIAGNMERSVYWLIMAGHRTVGLVWLSNVYKGFGANLNIILKKRRFLRPKRVDPKRVKIHNIRQKSIVDTVFDEVFSFCFDNLQMKRLTAPIPVTRRAAIGMAKRFGFSNEGCMKDAVMNNGGTSDLIIWGYTEEMYRRAQRLHDNRRQSWVC